jgi:hypothetical protein
VPAELTTAGVDFLQQVSAAFSHMVYQQIRS